MNEVIRTVADIAPADRVVLSVLDVETGNVKRCPSLVQDIDEMGIAVSMPAADQIPVLISEGASVGVSIWKGYADHRFKSRVLKRVEGRVPQLILSRPKSEEIVHTPRRQSFRVDTRVSTLIIHTDRAPVRTFIISGDNPPFPVEMGTVQHLTQRSKDQWGQSVM